MSGLLAAIACGFLGMAVGAALKRWGDGARRHTAWGHEEPDDYEGAKFV